MLAHDCHSLEKDCYVNSIAKQKAGVTLFTGLGDRLGALGVFQKLRTSGAAYAGEVVRLMLYCSKVIYTVRCRKEG